MALIGENSELSNPRPVPKLRFQSRELLLLRKRLMGWGKVRATFRSRTQALLALALWKSHYALAGAAKAKFRFMQKSTG